MLPIEIRSLTHDLTLTGMGLREPVAGTPIPVSLIDLVVVPGLGFDVSGNRLGRGRGLLRPLPGQRRVPRRGLRPGL